MIDGLMEKGVAMNVFKTFTLKWWQTGLFKLGMLSLGIAIGAYWHAVFGNYLVVLAVVAAVSLTYISFAWWKQQ